MSEQSNQIDETGNSTISSVEVPEAAMKPIERASGLNRKRKVEFTLPPPKEPALSPEPTTITTIDPPVSTSAQETDAQQATPTSSRATNETVSRRPNDVVYQVHEPRNEFMPPPLEPSDAAFKVPSSIKQQDDTTDDASASLSNVLPLRSYSTAQRFLIENSLHAANFTVPREVPAAATSAKSSSTSSTPTTATKTLVPQRQNISTQASNGVLQSAFAQAQQPNVGIAMASYVNHFTRTLTNRAHANGDGISSLRPTPYIENSASTYVTTFVSAAIEEAPSENAVEFIPSDEQRAFSSATLFSYNKSFQRSVRPGEFACAKGDRCWGMNLFDSHRRPLPKTQWPVYWFQEEIQMMRANPDKMKQQAVERVCVGDMWKDANILTNHAAMRNTRVGTNWVISRAHVLVNVPGEYCIEQTQGLCSNGYRGLINQVPVQSDIGWSATPDPHYSGCYIYENVNIHPFPLPAEYYHGDSPAQPLALAANQMAPAAISTPGGGPNAVTNQKRGF